jgi:hypothetical protein
MLLRFQSSGQSKLRVILDTHKNKIRFKTLDRYCFFEYLKHTNDGTLKGLKVSGGHERFLKLVSMKENRSQYRKKEFKYGRSYFFSSSNFYVSVDRTRVDMLDL